MACYRSKAVVPVLVLLFGALCFILRGDLLHVLPCAILFLCFSVLLALRLPRLGKRELILVLFVCLIDLCLFWICRFPLPLDVWEGLRFVIVALPGLFSYLFVFCKNMITFVSERCVIVGYDFWHRAWNPRQFGLRFICSPMCLFFKVLTRRSYGLRTSLDIYKFRFRLSYGLTMDCSKTVILLQFCFLCSFSFCCLSCFWWSVVLCCHFMLLNPYPVKWEGCVLWFCPFLCISIFNLYHSLCWFRIQFDIFLIFCQKTEFDISYKLSPGDNLHEMSKSVFEEK